MQVEVKLCLERRAKKNKEAANNVKKELTRRTSQYITSYMYMTYVEEKRAILVLEFNCNFRYNFDLKHP